MTPYKRKPRTGGSMVVLGGWLFADLLLGLAMLFAVATTVGAPPPTPTPTATPNLLATSQAQLASEQNKNSDLQNQIAMNNTSAQQTAEAQQDTIDSQQQTAEAIVENQQAVNARATEAANVEATRAAESDSQRATEDAASTQQAIESQATISAYSTQQAEAANSNSDLNNQLATNEAKATEQAASGVNVQATIDALNNQIAENNNSLATSQAQADSYQSTSAALTQQQGDVQATISAAQQEAINSGLNPNARNVTISGIDRQGVYDGDSQATADAKSKLEAALKPYLDDRSCTIGYVVISTNSPDVQTGSQVSKAIGNMIQDDYSQLVPKTSNGKLAFYPVAGVGASPDGEVDLVLFLNNGCGVGT